MFMCISSQEDSWILEIKKYSAYFVDLNKLIFPENMCVLILSFPPPPHRSSIILSKPKWFFPHSEIRSSWSLLSIVSPLKDWGVLILNNSTGLYPLFGMSFGVISDVILENNLISKVGGKNANLHKAVTITWYIP